MIEDLELVRNNKKSIEDLIRLSHAIGATEDILAEREVHCDIVGEVSDAKRMIDAAICNLRDIINGDNPFA